MLLTGRVWFNLTYMSHMATIVDDLYKAGGGLGEAAKYRTSWFEIQVASQIESWTEGQKYELLG